jgi:hypothetical protein
MGGGTPVEAIRLGPARFAGWAMALCAEQRGRYFEAERLRGLEVDDQLVLGRRLDRKVGRLLALEDAVDVARRTPVKKLFDHLVGEHCIVLGTARPSAAAVFKLTTSSNLVGCRTGRSAGLAPLRMRPT